MPRELPPEPHLDHLKAQAKELLTAARRGDPAAQERFRTAGVPSPSKPALAQAQLVLAREYGFPSWRRLKAHVAAIRAPTRPVDEAMQAFHRSDAPRLRSLLRRHPELRALVNRPFPGASFGTLPLIAAARHGTREMIEVLLEAGADIQGRSEWWAGGFGVLDDARADLVPFLIERGARLDAYNAARLGWADRLRDLLVRDPGQARARFGDGRTALHVADSVEVAALLLEHGASIEALDVDHESTPAQYLIKDRPEVARYLVERGAQADLLLATALGDLDRVRALLDRDPDTIRISVSDAWFPRRNPRSGGTIYIWTLGQHRTPHLVAHERAHRDVLDLLLDRSPLPLRLSTACEIGDEGLLASLRVEPGDTGVLLTAADRRRLPEAAQSRNGGAVRLLLAAGWPVDSPAESGETALHWAAWHGDAGLVRDLLRHGPGLELRDREHHATPLGWAIHGSVHGWHRESGDYGAVVAALLQAGAAPPPAGSEVDASPAALEALERDRASG